MKRTAVLAVLVAMSGTAIASTPDQVAQSFEDSILPENNDYGSPSTMWRDDAGDIHGITTCSGYAALLVETAHPTVTTTVLKALVGTSLPTTAQWKAAFDKGATYSNTAGKFRLVTRPTLDTVVAGDIFTSDYTSAGTTGHTMTIGSAWLDATAVVTTIPGEPTANRWVLYVHDSSSVPHGTSDSRWHADGGVDDLGIGNGFVYAFTDATTGAIVGWTWNTYSTTTYQTTDPTADNYRPVTVGTVTGPGIK